MRRRDSLTSPPASDRKLGHDDLIPDRQREVLRGLAPKVNSHLDLLTAPAEAWQPSDFLPDLGAPDWREQLAAFREVSVGLSDEVLVVLVGDMVTEEALPSYSVSLNTIAEDHNGTSEAPWALWLRGWTAEENRHGDLLSAFLRLSGRVDMRSVELTVQHLLRGGFSSRTRGDLYGGLIYTSFQERATRISHGNVGRLALAEGHSGLSAICRRIAGDEARHERFYTLMMNAVLDADPEGGLLSIGKMLRRTIAMPGRLMFDGKDADLFDHFSIVAQRIGVYTVLDYVGIIRHLVDAWSIADRTVAGDAALAQEQLCVMAERVESMAVGVGDRIAMEPRRSFAWIHDRLA